jgi:large subunit ribosomal protein L1
MKRSKRYRQFSAQFTRSQEYEVSEAFKLVKELASAKFDETVEAAIKLGVDPRKSDQMVRGAVSLPHGTGKVVRVLVLCKPAKEEEALKAGADMAGLEDYIEKIKSGWTDVDVIVATPDVMAMVGKLGRILGPRGLMPNPKVGTVTMDVGNITKQLKAGQVSFKVDKTGNIHVGIGKVSFEAEKLIENFESLVRALIRMRPPAAKGQYLVNLAISSTMGPGVKINRMSVMNLMK